MAKNLASPFICLYGQIIVALSICSSTVRSLRNRTLVFLNQKGKNTMLKLLGAIALGILLKIASRVAERMMPPQYRWVLAVLSIVL
jgi:hypothetical protein